MMESTNVAIIGGGAAGMSAACASAQSGANTLLIEKNDRLGKKLFLTGHGRCNVTNAADFTTYQSKIFRNPKFVLGALHRFGPRELEAFLRQNGIKLKQEDSGRMFPVSDRSSDIIKAFREAMHTDGVRMMLSTIVHSVVSDGGRFVLSTDAGTLRACAVVVATGGLSYPSTGSTGDGLTFARETGHDVTPTTGALVGLTSNDSWLSKMAGLTLKNVSIRLVHKEQELAYESGDVLFTHSGLSGPAVLRASCHLPLNEIFPITALIDFKPDKPAGDLDGKLVSAARLNANKEVRTILESWIPKRLTPVVMTQASIPATQKMNQLSRQQRQDLVCAIKAFHVSISGRRPISEAIITNGGVSTKQIDPRTMESRIVPGLFFAGELIDVAAVTGGYNLQIAFSTGWCAGTAAAAYCLDHTQ